MKVRKKIVNLKSGMNNFSATHWFYLRSFTKILQCKNIRYGPIKHVNVCVSTLSFNNFLSLKLWDFIQ